MSKPRFSNRWRYSWLLLVLAIAASCGLGLGGCQTKNAPPGVESITGSILSVDPNSRKVVIEYRRKQGADPGRLEAFVPKEAEIMINGSVSTLEQLRIGEKVTGYGTKTQTHGRTLVTALKIYVERSSIIPREPQHSSSQPGPKSTTSQGGA